MSAMRIGARAFTTHLLSKGQTGNSLVRQRNISTTNINKMKFVQFAYKDDPKQIRAGYLEGDRVVDINKVDSKAPLTLLGLLNSEYVNKVSGYVNFLFILCYSYLLLLINKCG